MEKFLSLPLAGFVMALPLATLLALLFNHMQFHDTANAVKFALPQLKIYIFYTRLPKLPVLW